MRPIALSVRALTAIALASIACGAENQPADLVYLMSQPPPGSGSVGSSSAPSTPSAGIDASAGLADAGAPSAPAPLEFPRLTAMAIGGKLYDDPAVQAELAKFDLVVLGMYYGWKRNGVTPLQATTAIRKLNPKIRLANYTIMTETLRVANAGSDYRRNKLLAEKGPGGVGDWWAYDAAGNHTDWANGLYGNWDTNLTLLTTPDANGDHYPEWLAQEDYPRFIANGAFDVWYCDNNFWRPRVDADWNRDGVNDSKDDVKVRNWFRDGQRAYYDRAHKVAPNAKIMVNTDSDLSGDAYPSNSGKFPQYAKVADLAFIERAFGKSWSVETWGGFNTLMSWYRSLEANLLERGGATLDAYMSSATDYRTARYALATTLLDDGYFSASIDYAQLPWFDEFDLAGTASTKWLGAAVDPPPAAPFQKGVWRRRFEHGMAIVNPKGNGPQTVTIESGYRHFLGEQDPAVNDGKAVTTITLADRDGVLLIKP